MQADMEQISEIFQMTSMDSPTLVNNNEELPAWRRNPESSYSDWTIRVIQSTEDEDDGLEDGEEENSGDAAASHGDNKDKNFSDETNQTTTNTPQTPLSPGAEHRSRTESTYHVHRVFLASGPRKSEYFQTLFSLATKHTTEETHSRTTELVLPESACWVFPRLLDYIYDGGGNNENPNLYDPSRSRRAHPTMAHPFDADRSEIACREEVALAFLADYLRVSKLIDQTRYRVMGVLDDSNIHVVCREALLYSIDWIVDDCIRMAAQSPRDLLPHPPAYTAAPSHRSRSRTPSPTARRSRNSNDSTSTNPLVDPKQPGPPALQMIRMLPVEKQNELLAMSLSNSLCELERFKRVPSRWKNNIDDVLATHMPTLTGSGNPNNNGGSSSSSNLGNGRQGCGLPFPQNKICPLFYFDGEPRPPSPPSPPPLSP